MATTYLNSHFISLGKVLAQKSSSLGVALFTFSDKLDFPDGIKVVNAPSLKKWP